MFVARNVQVDAGAPLLRIEPLEDGGQAPAAAPSAAHPLRPVDDVHRRRCRHVAAASCSRLLRGLVLGFDIDAADRLAELVSRVRAATAPVRPRRAAARSRRGSSIFSAFVHLSALTRELKSDEADTIGGDEPT